MFDSTNAIDSLIHAVDFGQNDRLRTIFLLRDTHFSHQQPFIYPGAYVFAQITSPCIEEVVVHVGFTSGGNWLRNLDWDTMDRVFERPNFSQLKRVLVLVWGHNSCVKTEVRADMLSWLAQRLPACHARGIIDVKITLSYATLMPVGLAPTGRWNNHRCECEPRCAS
jgi:hypothetical protein